MKSTVATLSLFRYKMLGSSNSNRDKEKFQNPRSNTGFALPFADPSDKKTTHHYRLPICPMAPLIWPHLFFFTPRCAVAMGFTTCPPLQSFSITVYLVGSLSESSESPPSCGWPEYRELKTETYGEAEIGGRGGGVGIPGDPGATSDKGVETVARRDCREATVLDAEADAGDWGWRVYFDASLVRVCLGLVEEVIEGERDPGLSPSASEKPRCRELPSSIGSSADTARGRERARFADEGEGRGRVVSACMRSLYAAARLS